LGGIAGDAVAAAAFVPSLFTAAATTAAGRHLPAEAWMLSVDLYLYGLPQTILPLIVVMLWASFILLIYNSLHAI
jgi:hypothetical protein